MQQEERKTHTVDATDRPLGRLAVEVATLLRGKNKSGFEMYKDVGDFVTVTNIKHIKFTGNKPEQKIYYRHSGYLGGLKEKPLGKLFQERPEEILRKAVWGMLPKNKLRGEQINRLSVQ